MSLHGARTMAQLQENDIIICFILSTVAVVFIFMLLCWKKGILRMTSAVLEDNAGWLVLTLFFALWVS